MREAEAWADELLAAARNGARPLTSKQIFALAGLWYRRLLHDWEANPTAAAAWHGWDETLPSAPWPFVTGLNWDVEDDDSLKMVEREWDAFLAPFIAYANELLGREGIVTDAASKRLLAYTMTQRLGQALARFERRQHGDYSPDPLPTQFPVLERPIRQDNAPATTVGDSETAKVPLSKLFEDWKRVAVVKPSTAYETSKVIEMVIAFVGHDDAARLSRDTLLAWRQASKAEGRVNNTWNNRLSMLAQVLRRGIEDGKLTVDPTEKLRLRKNKPAQRYPYSNQDAARILVAARRETKPSLRWAHWIMCFTGMRAGEVLQLTRKDIRNESGIWYIEVHEDDEGKTVKTGQRRQVPIHEALVAEGFIRYVETIDGDAPLFPEKKADMHGNRGGRAWQLLGRWVRTKVGITDTRYAPDHSWRHRIEDELRIAEVPEDARDAITGHARKTTGRQYGVIPSL
jgi:integrase